MVCFAYSSPISLELTGGSTIKGELVKWDGQQATVQTDFGKFTLSKNQLSEATLADLAISSGDNSALKAKISELQSVIESLRRDNTALRDALAGTPTRFAAPVPFSSGAAGISLAPTGDPSAVGYWISSTGKRHNSNCRYFQTSKGRPGGATEGVACKICGG